MKKILWVLSSLMFLIQPLFADIIFIKDGTQVNGIIKEMKENIITVQTEFGTIQIPKNRITNIIYDNKEIQQNNSHESEKIEKPKKGSGDSSTEPDSWYFGLFLGFGAAQMQGDLNSFYQNLHFDQTTSQDKKRGLFYLDFSLYATGNQNLLIGGGFSFFLFGKDSDNNEITTQELSFDGAMLQLEIKFFPERVGSGFFLSVAPGFSMISVSRKKYEGKDFDSELGLGIKAGFGYAVPLKHFAKSFLIGVEGFYINAKYKSDNSGSKERWGLAGGYVYAGWLW